jgi:TIR domain
MTKAEKGTYDLFISYSSEDSAFSNRLADELHERGLQVWIDKDDIKGGENWEQKIKEVIDKTNVCLVVLSGASDPARPWCSQEWSAMQEGSWRRPEMSICSLQLGHVDTPPFLRKWQSLRLQKPQENMEETADRIFTFVTKTAKSGVETASEREDKHAVVERFTTMRDIIDEYKLNTKSG